MLVPSRNATRLISALYSSHTVSQGLRTVTVAAGETGAALKKTRGKRQKDVYVTELPKAYVKADGSGAVPLPPFRGGLKSSSNPPSIPEQAINGSQELIETITNDNVASLSGMVPSGAIQQVKRPRGRPKSNTVSASVSTLVNTDTGTGLSSNKPKATRKRKQNVSSSDSASLPTTPLANDILDNLQKYPHCILLTRVGQFYESYFDQAIEVAHLLGIKLTSKSWGGGRVPMAGFPIIHLNKYLKTLVQENHRFVAMCEEFMRDHSLGPKGGFNRRVTRIVTPGTLIDEPFLNPYENNYLLSISPPHISELQSKPWGLAWIDVSTGEFFTKVVSEDGLRDELARLAPREVVLDETFSEELGHPVHQALKEEECFVSYVDHSQTPKADSKVLPGIPSNDELTSSSVSSDPAFFALSGLEAEAANMLTVYLTSNLLEHMPQLSSPSREMISGRMQIDAHTIKALEIKESMREGGTKGSLLSVVKRTKTTSGTRLLARWLCSPSTSIDEITARQALVTFFYARPHLREDLVCILLELEDATRILQKFLVGRGDANDLAAMCKTMEVWTSIQKRIHLEKNMEETEKGGLLSEEWTSIDSLMSRLTNLQEVAAHIEAAVGTKGRESQHLNNSTSELTGGEEDVFEMPSAMSGYDWTVKPDFSKELNDLHAALASLVDQRQKLEIRLQNVYAAPSLSLRMSPQLGMHVHVANARRDLAKIKVDSGFLPISESKTTSSFFYGEWSQLGSRLVETSTAICSAERVIFGTLRDEVKSHATTIRRNARIMDELDVTLAFANLAREMNFVRPAIKDDTSYNVTNGRHPTVELGLLTSAKTFVPNTVTFTPDSTLHVITGPNMAGKSTLLRQTALVAILAQTGSYVPADSAEIGIIDRVFSRVGAKDDLFRERSTFMVEMLETADILRRATPRSLVIMDEVGRGTTVEDGLAVAFGAVHHLLSKNQCRTLFATHFYELADMLGYTDKFKGQGLFEGVRFYCTGVDETDDGYFTYNHKLRPGVNRDGHGLKVALLAGMPKDAVDIAQKAKNWLRERRNSTFDRDRIQLQSLGQTIASNHTTTP